MCGARGTPDFLSPRGAVPGATAGDITGVKPSMRSPSSNLGRTGGYNWSLWLYLGPGSVVNGVLFARGEVEG